MDIPEIMIYYIIYIFTPFFIVFGGFYIFVLFIYRLMHESEKEVI